MHLLKMNWITSSNTIIFGPTFNSKLDIEMISCFKIIIFSDYELNEKLFWSYTNNDFNGLEYVGSIFNQDI